MVINTREVDGRTIYIIDEAISKEGIDDFYKFINSLSYTKKEQSDEDDQYPIFSVNFHANKFEEQTEVGSLGKELLEKLRSKEYSLYRAYINMCHYGDVEYPHLDCESDEDDITVLYYANKDWHYTWGGETQFYESHEAVMGVTPRPGRYVVFDGNIEHMGTIPTRICNTSRYTLAMKYSRVKKADDE